MLIFSIVLSFSHYKQIKYLFPKDLKSIQQEILAKPKLTLQKAREKKYKEKHKKLRSLHLKFLDYKTLWCSLSFQEASKSPVTLQTLHWAMIF